MFLSNNNPTNSDGWLSSLFGPRWVWMEIAHLFLNTICFLSSSCFQEDPGSRELKHQPTPLSGRSARGRGGKGEAPVCTGPSQDRQNYVSDPPPCRPADASEEGGLTFCTTIGPLEDSTCCVPAVRRLNILIIIRYQAGDTGSNYTGSPKRDLSYRGR